MSGAFSAALESYDSFLSRHASQIRGPFEVGDAQPVASGRVGYVSQRDTRCSFVSPEKAGPAVIVERAGVISEQREGKSRVYLMGAPMHDVRGDDIPLSLLVRIVSSEDEGACYERVLDSLRSPYIAEGCMMQASAAALRVRISKKAVRRGLDWRQFAESVLGVVRAAAPGALEAEALIVIGDAQASRELSQTAQLASQAAYELRRQRWADAGVDIECTGFGHCGSCSDKDTCSQVQRIARLRELGKRRLSYA